MDKQVLADVEYNKQRYKEEDLATLFRYAAKECKKGPLEIVKEFLHLTRGDGRLSISDYFLYRLFDDKCLSMADKERFISDRIQWAISEYCNDSRWSALTEDKWAAYQFMSACDIPTPTTLAVIDTSGREFGRTPKITGPSELKEFLQAQTEFPMFAKDNGGLGSFGAFVVADIEGDLIIRGEAEPISCDAVFTEVVGGRSYLLQRFLRAHADIQPLSRYCATVRTMNMYNDGSVSTPYALLKVPGPASIADNYWRPGNIIADVDLNTGEIRRAVTGRGIALKELSHHPQTSEPLVGKSLPLWSELRALNETCARLYAPVRFNSLDIALTPDGPIVVEVNTGGAFNLPQLARGKGLLTGEVHDFFATCGWNFKRPRRRSPRPLGAGA